jgi:phage baseplate assembly protein W
VLGTGWAFPVGVGRDDDVQMAAGADDIAQAVRLILETDPGERVMRPDFGAGLRRLLFEPMSNITLALVQHRVREALVTWEPRIDVLDIVVSAEDAASGRLLISIDYTMRATNSPHNLVLPFYAREAA